jgi:signal transduction histidine kinase
VSAGKVTILNVNDREVPRYTVEQMLRRAGFEVRSVDSGLAALDAAQEEAPDIIVLDVRLPDVDGYEVCRRLKAHAGTRGIPVLLTSACFTTAERRVEGLDAGADGYLVQPFDARELIATVRALLRVRAAERAARQALADREEALRLRDLVDNLLDVSCVQLGRLALHPTRMDLRELVEEVVDNLGPDLERAGCALTLEAPEPVWGMWDRMRLEQVVTNLVSNALKYGAGRPVHVGVRAAPPDQGLLTVCDQGIGIDPTDHTRIFERFQRTEAARSIKGIGLGLWIVRQLVGASGGSIHVESELGHGACFRVLLPGGLVPHDEGRGGP